MTYRQFLLGAAVFFALAPAVHGQIRPARRQPQRPVEVPQAVVVLPVDTTDGDSTRTIIQRDFDYGDRIQPLLLDSTTMADIWKPGDATINVSPLAQTRVNFLVRGRPTPAGLRIEVFDPKGALRQGAVFRLPKIPPNRLPAIRDSLSRLLGMRTRATDVALAADSAARDSLAGEASRPTPLKHPGQRVAARL